MAGRVGDLAGFIRGLENISKALFKYQSNEWSRIWMNSSLRTAVEECTTKTKETCTSYSKPSYSTQEKPEQDSASDDVIKEKKIFSSESDFNTNFQSDSVVRDSSREKDKKQEHKKVSTVKTTNLPRNASERISQEETPSPTAVKTNQPAKQAPVKTDSATFLMSEENKLNPSSRQRRVPVSRVSRLVNYGGLAAGLGIGALAEVARRSVGLGDKAKSPFLTEANAERIVNTLCRVRGAALKLGQLLSIQDNSMISPQWQAIFERVRQSADFMPSSQTLKVMNKELGPDWRSKVSSFDEKPFAAASIGQVHLATLKNGRKVAIKVQYPGVAKSIDSDINNLMAVLNVWEILPPGMYIESAIEVAKTELAWEVDYIREAKYCRLFRELLKDYPAYYVPEVIDDLSTKLVFTTEYIEGLPLDHCIDFDQETRNWLGESILKLCLIELFKFRVMQTDPNWSNFYYNPQTGKINLLDFGASRDFPKPFIDKYISIIKSATVGDTEAVLKGSREIGFLTGYETKIMEEAHVDAVMILGESFAKDGEFDFGTQNTTNRIQNLIPVMIKHRLTPPPKEAYSLHKKMSGAFLLCNKLKCRIRCKDIFDDVWKNYRFGDEDKLI